MLFWLLVAYLLGMTGTLGLVQRYHIHLSEEKHRWDYSYITKQEGPLYLFGFWWVVLFIIIRRWRDDIG